jgi:hypothetical protein
MLFAEPTGEVLLAWCAALTWHKDVALAGLLPAAARSGFASEAAKVVRDRVVEGPLADALACAPLLGTGSALTADETAEARARLQILVWEAGASALELPRLGPWIWGSKDTFEAMVHEPARGTLRGRVLAARMLEVSVRRDAPTTDPLSSVRRSRCCSRSCFTPSRSSGYTRRARSGASRARSKRSRAPARLGPRRVACAAAARDHGPRVAPRRAPHAPREPARERSSTRATKRRGCSLPSPPPRRTSSSSAARSGIASRSASSPGTAAPSPRARWPAGLAHPLAPRRRPRRRREDLARAARDGAPRRSAIEPRRVRRWIEVIASPTRSTAPSATRSISSSASRTSCASPRSTTTKRPTRAPRASRAPSSPFQEARRIALECTGPPRQRAAAINALEGCARAFALRLWGPLLATRPGEASPSKSPTLAETWEAIARAPAEILDNVEERRAARRRRRETDLPRGARDPLGGYALDACGEDADLGPGRGPTAHDTCLWLRKVDGPRRRLARAPRGARARSARCSGASSTPRAAPPWARSTTCGGSGPSRRGGRSSSIGPRCCSSSRRRCR